MFGGIGRNGIVGGASKLVDEGIDFILVDWKTGDVNSLGWEVGVIKELSPGGNRGGELLESWVKPWGFIRRSRDHSGRVRFRKS